VVIGSGGHATSCIDLLLASSSRIQGICDLELPAGAKGPFDVIVLGDDTVLDRLPHDSTPLANGIGSLKDNSARRRVYQDAIDRGFSFPTLVHPSAVVSSSAELADGVQIMAGCVVQAGVKIASNSIVNTRASIDHHGIIGEHCHIAPGAILCGSVQVGPNTHIGAGAVVVQGITIGTGCFVAAGSLVSADVPDGVHVGPGNVLKRETL